MLPTLYPGLLPAGMQTLSSPSLGSCDTKFKHAILNFLLSLTFSAQHFQDTAETWHLKLCKCFLTQTLKMTHAAIEVVTTTNIHRQTHYNVFHNESKQVLPKAEQCILGACWLQFGFVITTSGRVVLVIKAFWWPNFQCIATNTSCCWTKSFCVSEYSWPHGLTQLCYVFSGLLLNPCPGDLLPSRFWSAPGLGTHHEDHGGPGSDPPTFLPV